MNWTVPDGAWFPDRIVRLESRDGALLVVLEDQKVLRFDSWDDMAAFRDAFHAEAVANDKKYLATVAAETIAKKSEHKRRRKVSPPRRRDRR